MEEHFKFGRATSRTMWRVSLLTVLRGIVIMVLFGYFSSRVYISYSKLLEGKIGTLFNRVTSATVKVKQK